MPNEMEAELEARAGELVREVRRHHVLITVFLGGALGTLARAGLSTSVQHAPDQWPWATFIVNAVGALLLGWWSTRLMRSPDVDPRLRPFLATGICGGLTTFSTMQIELVLMLNAHAYLLAVIYGVVMIVIGLAAVVLGQQAAHALHQRTRRETTS
jgi:CrcB protein